MMPIMVPNIGIVEKKMETTIVYWGIYWGNIGVIYAHYGTQYRV